MDDYGIGPWQFARIDLGEANDYREYGRPGDVGASSHSTRKASMPVSLLRKMRVFTQVRVGGFSEVWPGGAQRLAEHVSDGPRGTLPIRSTFRWMPSTRPAIP